jgi:hypothetical protein
MHSKHHHEVVEEMHRKHGGMTKHHHESVAEHLKKHDGYCMGGKVK